VAEPKRIASIRDVAKRANVSISTVSRVISKKIPVDEQTQKRVRTAINELNYRPNLIASGLRSKSGKSIGLLVPMIQNPFFMVLIDHIDRCVISRGYNLLLYNTHSDLDFEKQILDNLLRRHVDGIIFSLVSDESRAVELLTAVEVPVVMLDRVRADTRLMSVVLDNRKAGEIAAEHLIDLGHRSFACLSGPTKIRLCAERLAGFTETLSRRGIGPANCQVLLGDFSLESGIAAAQRLLQTRPAVTAVWAHSDLMAAGLLKGFQQAGVMVPAEVSVMGMDDAFVPEIVNPSLTTIAQPIGEMAQRAVEMILEMKGSSRAQREVLLNPHLVVRESTGARKRQEG
jgi:DNA-binding LacI/PurR family transcriptional regulator